MTSVAIAAGTELHIDIEKEDCWIKVAATATREEVLAAYAQAEAAGLEEEEESIEYNDDYTGWSAHFRFGPELMKERGMV